MATERKKRRTLDTLFPKPILRPSLTRNGKSLLAAALRGDAELRKVSEWPHEQVAKIKVVKLIGLLAVHGLTPNDPDCWFILALRLAEQYHPGFKVVAESDCRRGGRSKTRADDICREVNKRKLAGKKFAAIFQELSKDPRFCGPSKSPAEIKARYYEANRKHKSIGGKASKAKKALYN